MHLLLIHGSGATGAVWAGLRAQRPEAVAVDLPGRDGDAPLPSVAAYAAWLRERGPAPGDGPLVLVGHSLGGAVALAYALAWPEELAAIVLVASGARLRVHPDLLAGLADPATADATLEQFLARMHRRIEPREAARLTERFRRVGAATLLNDLRACDAFDVMARIPELAVPLLAICGEDDDMTPPKYSRYLAAQAADGRAVLIPAATHMLPAEQPRAVATAIADFLATLPGAG